MPDLMTMDPNVPLKRMPRKERPEYTKVLIPWLAFASGMMLLFGLLDLLGAKSIIDYLKCGLIAVTASSVAFGINRLAIERGAYQAAIGTPGAAFLSLGSMGVVAAGLFAATVAGLTLGEVERLRLEQFGRVQAAFVQAQQQSAMHAARVIPGVRSIVADLTAKESCERASGCVSGRGGGEDGPVSRALGNERQRAEAILSMLDKGGDLRVAAVEEMNRLQSAYHTMVSDDSLSVVERRARANDLAIHVSQTATALAETDPVAFVAGFADELASGASANQTINDLRRSYAQQLRTVVASVQAERPETPVLPAKAGVADSLSYVGHFLPIALIVLAVEAVLPLALWLYTYFAFLARLERDDPQDPARDADRDHPAPSRNGRRTGRAG